MSGAKRRFRPNIIQISLIVFLLVTFYFSIANIISTHKNVKRLDKELKKVNNSIVSVKRKQEEVNLEIDRWNDPALIEEVARKELGFVRPGEVTYMFSEPFQSINESEVTKRKGSSEGIGN